MASVGNARDFSSGRQFAAWLGLIPRQHPTGGKPRLGHITRRSYHKTLVAIAAKNARIAWALLSKQQRLRAT